MKATAGRCPPLTLAIRAAGRRREPPPAAGSARRGPRQHPWGPPPAAARRGRGARPILLLDARGGRASSRGPALSCCCCTRSAREAAPAPWSASVLCVPLLAACTRYSPDLPIGHCLQRLNALLSSVFELNASSWSENFTCAVPVHDVEDIFRPLPVSGKLLNFIFPGHTFQTCYCTCNTQMRSVEF